MYVCVPIFNSSSFICPHKQYHFLKKRHTVNNLCCYWEINRRQVSFQPQKQRTKNNDFLLEHENLSLSREI